MIKRKIHQCFHTLLFINYIHVGLDYNYYNLLYINYIYTTIFKEPDNIAEETNIYIYIP